MNRLVSGFFWLALGTATGLTAQNDAVSYVSPLVGTQRSVIGYGGTMPFVTPPFGMTDWTPQTRQNKISVVSYNYDDATISGFIGTHQPAIWMGDYGYVTVIPQVGELRTTPESREASVQSRIGSSASRLLSCLAGCGSRREDPGGDDGDRTLRLLSLHLSKCSTCTSNH